MRLDKLLQGLEALGVMDAISKASSGATRLVNSITTLFTQLTDTPNSYTGASDKFVNVKTDESGLEFTALGDLAEKDTLSHGELTGVGVSDHHVRYTNVEAIIAAESRIGTTIQAWDPQLDDIAALDASQNDNFIVSGGGNWTQETPAQVRATLGLVSGGAGDIWVEKAGDTMTGQLFIDGGADEIQHRVQGVAGQAANIATWEDSATNVLVKIGAGDATDFFQVNQADGTSVLTVDTINERFIYGNNDIVFDKSFATSGGGYFFVDGLTSGVVDGEFGFIVGGVGSSSALDGPGFFARGNSFSRIGNQRGNMYFIPGFVGGMGATEGEIQFISSSTIQSLTIKKNSFIGINSTTPSAQLYVRPSVATAVGQKIVGVAGQSANLSEWQDSAGTVKAFVDPNGRAVFGAASFTQNEALRVVAPAGNTVAEDLASFEVSDSAGFIRMKNTDGFNTRLSPQLQMRAAGNTLNASVWQAEILAGNDAGSQPIMIFDARRHSPFAQAVTRPLMAFQNFAASGRFMLVSANGRMSLAGLGAVTQGTGMFNVTPLSASTVGSIIKGFASQTANLSEWLDSSANVHHAISLPGATDPNTYFNKQLGDSDFIVAGDTEANLLRVDAGLDAVHLGDWDTNYAKFAVDGELTLVGTARVIKHVQAIDELGRGGSAPTVRTTEEPYVSYTYAVNNDSHITFEIPEDMDFTVVATIKVHWYTSVDQTDDEVNWEARWNSRAPGEAVNAGETIDTSGDTNCPAQWQILETTVETVPANSCAAGDIFGIHLERIAIVDGTNPAATSIHALSVEFEYTANKLGEAT